MLGICVVVVGIYFVLSSCVNYGGVLSCRVGVLCCCVGYLCCVKGGAVVFVCSGDVWKCCVGY